MRRFLLAMLLLHSSACSSEPSAEGDTGSVAIDSAADAAVDDGAPEVTPCPLEIDGGSCHYFGYGTTCRVPCMVPSSCTFNTRLRWTGGYCCGSGGVEVFDGCKCQGGEAICANGVAEAGPPTTYCEFCNPDTGSAG